MQAETCPGEQVCGKDLHCGDCLPVLDPAAAQAIGTPDIPVRRYGTVPPLPEDERVWEIESGRAPRTIADHGGILVLLAGILAAVLGAWLLYLL